ncbi:tyrosine-type recombinase/integrase [Streptomyces niveus]|uniref:tyrosine-type recombinase/integrase n=1 Tax=Streptomyces niveus TaxID=193462 RepID=UPI0036B54030
MTTALAAVRPDQASPRVDALMSAVTLDFLKLMSWESTVRLLHFPKDHPLLGAVDCLVDGCDKPVFHKGDRGLCSSCARRLQRSNQSFEEFVASTKHHWRGTGISHCRVPRCDRPWKTSGQPLCVAHLHQQQKIYRLPVEEFIHHPEVQPLTSLGRCAVAACSRDLDGRSTSHCNAHAQRRALELRRGSTVDEDTWNRTSSAIAQSRVVSLRGLPDLVVAEILYAFQERTAAHRKQTDGQLRPFCDMIRAKQVSSLSDLDPDSLSRNNRHLLSGFLKHVNRFQISPETEHHKDVWDGAAFGLKGNAHFTAISQPWLRRATQDWAIDNIPQRRGDNPMGTVQRLINSIVRLSESLRLHREDQGLDLRLLGRADVLSFLNRLRYLEEKGEISATRRCTDVRDVRRLLNRMRTLGLTQAGRPLHGLPEEFSLREEDIPDDPEDTEAGRDLPPEVMDHLCGHLDRLEAGSRDARITVELLIDTGRRPGEICDLPLDCLERDNDGKPVLIYDNHKAFRLGRRLPIAESTAALVLAQQQNARAQFPNTPAKKLKLFPSSVVNPDGTKSASTNWLTDRHRAWVDSLPAVFVPTVVIVDGERVTKMVPFDKSKIFPYAYRHTYAQRHADARVEPDVLRVLMDHRQLSTTQRYYRVSDHRKREAVERVSAMQFDRHGNRIWRPAKDLLDSEYARRAVGEVQAPYGVCIEPSNVAAGGHACPARFRCVGCDHFRTDASYLPDLEAYLADLLRNRERLVAFTAADDWARAEATPSNEEITRVRRLIRRVKEDLDTLTDEDRAQIEEATTLLRRGRRQIVSLGMPRVSPPMPDFRPGRTA